MPFESTEQIRRTSELHHQQLDVCDENLEVRAADHAIVNDLLQNLDDGGTADTQRAVKDGVQGAEDTIRDQFEADHADAKREQGDAESVALEVDGIAASETQNAEQIAAARTDLKTEDVSQTLESLASELNDSSEIHQSEAEKLRVRTQESAQEAERLLNQVIRDCNR